MTLRALLITSTALSILAGSDLHAQPAPQGAPGQPGTTTEDHQKQRPGGQKQAPQAQPGKQVPPAAQGQPPHPPGQPPRPSVAQEPPKQEAPKQLPKSVQQPPAVPQPGAPARPAQTQTPQSPAAQGQPSTGQQPQHPATKELPKAPQQPAQGQPVPGQQPPAAQGRPVAPQTPSAQGQPATPQAPAAQGRPGAPQAPAAQGQPAQPLPPAAQGRPGAPQAPAAQGTPTQPLSPTAQGQPKPIPPAAPGQAIQLPGTNARSVEQLRGERREVREGNRTLIQEGDRTIVREGNQTIIRHNEVDRFRYGARDVRVDRRGNETTTVIERPDGVRIVTVTDENGRLIRRVRQDRGGREFVLIDNHYSGPGDRASYFVDLPPPAIRIPRERYIVEAERASEADFYAAFTAPPVERLSRRYTLDEIRYSPQVRDRMPRVDIDTINFESGSWEVTPDQAARLSVIAAAINQAIAKNPAEMFLIEGHTDAVGSDVDNLSLSDRRAETVALVLTQQFQVPAENLTTQGYGEQYLKIPTDAPERQNRRVTMRRITPLLAGGSQQGG